MPLFCKYTVHCADTLHHWVSLAIPVQGSDHNNNNKFLSPHHHHYYEVIISFTEVAVVTFGPFRLSLMSLRKTERFWVNLSLFFVNKVLSIPSIKFSNLKRHILRKHQKKKEKLYQTKSSWQPSCRPAGRQSLDPSNSGDGMVDDFYLSKPSALNKYGRR